MEPLLLAISDPRFNVYGRVASTSLLIIGVLALRALALHHIGRMEFTALDLRRRVIVSVRNTSVILILLGAVIIWADELRTLALSLVAIMAALVIALRELIACAVGGVYRITLKTHTIGDRIEIAALRGDVIDQTLLSTTIMEIGPGQMTHQHTGRVVVLPNSLLLTQPVINETYTEEYVAHSFAVPLEQSADWQRAERLLLEGAAEEVEPYLEAARRHMEKLQTMQGLAAPSVEPRVFVKIPEAGKVSLVVRVVVPARDKGRVEQAVVRRFLIAFRDGAA